MTSVEPQGRLELTWTNKALSLLADDEGNYEWVQPTDYRVAEVRLTGPDIFPGSSAGPSIAALADEATVRDFYGRLSDARSVRVVWGSGADEVRGGLALRLDLVDEAEQHYRAGIEWAEREHCPTEAAKCVQGLAEVAIRRGNTAEAMEHLDAASKVFEEHNNGLYLDQVIAKKLELQGVSSSDGSDGVTIVAPDPGETLPSGGVEGN